MKFFWRSIDWIFFLLLLSLWINILETSDSNIMVFPSKNSRFQGQVKHVKNILVDTINKKVFVGAMNRIFSISTDLKTDIKEIVWNASESAKKNCKKWNKNNEQKCQNFIAVLEFDFENNIFSCGTNALTPACGIFNYTNFKLPSEMIHNYRYYSLKTNEGTSFTLFLDPYLFIGISDRDEGLLVKLKPYESEVLATTKGTKIFEGQQPDFISIYSFDKSYAYFFLREHGHGGEKRRKVTYSMIGRVCKYDDGLSTHNLRYFVTLLKTRLQCNQRISLGNDIFYDELQSTFELKVENPVSKIVETFIYAVFSLSHELSLGSAICRYHVKDIENVFSKSDLYRKDRSTGRMVKEPFTPLRSRVTRSPCNASISINFDEMKKLDVGPQLLYDDVKPFDGNAIFTVNGVSFSSVVVDVLKNSKDMSIDELVIFGGTTKGFVYKIFIDKNGNARSIGNPFQPFEESKPIIDLKKMKDIIYAVASDGVASFKVDRCDIYSLKCEDCIMVRDPYCAWDVSNKKCVAANTLPENERENDSQEEVERICQKTTTPGTTTGSTVRTTTSTQSTKNTTTTQRVILNTTQVVIGELCSITIIQDDVITLQCSVNGREGDAIITGWSKDHQKLSNGTYYTIESLKNDTMSILTIRNYSELIPGTFECVSKSRDVVKSCSVESTEFFATRKPHVTDDKGNPSGRDRSSYYTQFVVMTVLFVLTLLLLIMLLIIILYRSRSYVKEHESVVDSTKNGRYRKSPLLPFRRNYFVRNSSQKVLMNKKKRKHDNLVLTLNTK